MPAGLLGDLGEASYGGYRFNNTTRTADYTVRPVADASGRTIAYRECSLTLETFIDSRTTTDPEVRRAVEALTQKGARLVFRGRGLGNPDVNTGVVKDVRWGPEPGAVRVKLIGAGNAVKLTWPVTFRLPPCDDGFDELAALELVYTVEHLDDDAGFVTRTLRGHLAVPITWDGDTRRLKDSADEYRIALTPPLVKGFHRTFGPWLLSEDRTRLDFSITDTERGGEALPPGVVESTFSENFSSSQKGLRQWQGTFSGSYRLHRTGNGLDAARAFFDRVTRRLEAIREGERTLPKDEKCLEVIPVGFSAVWPNAYDKPAAELSLSFTFVCSLPHLLKVTGLYVPVNSTTWQAWADSLADTAFHPYGATRLRFKVADDRLTDLCDDDQLDGGNPDARVARQATEELRTPGAGGPSLPVTRTQTEQLISSSFPVPKPESSWLHYSQEVWCDVDNGTVPARLLPLKVLTAADDILGAAADIGGRVIDAMTLGQMPRIAGEVPAGPGQPGGILDAAGDSTPLGTARRVRAVAVVYLRGYAVRAAYPVDIPRLLDVDGVEVIPANRLDRGEGFGKGVVANGNVPLHYARWNLRYLVPRLTGNPLETPLNPTLGKT